MYTTVGYSAKADQFRVHVRTFRASDRQQVAVDLTEGSGGEVSILAAAEDGWALVAELDAIRAKLAVALEEGGLAPPAPLTDSEVDRLCGEADLLRDELMVVRDRLRDVTADRDQFRRELFVARVERDQQRASS
jgi:hypothetical protein